MVTMITALEMSRQLTDCQARIKEMIAEIDRRDELIGELQQQVALYLEVIARLEQTIEDTEINLPPRT